MIRRRRADPGDAPDGPSPWATDDIEISSAPTEFDWTAVSPSAASASTNDGDDAEDGGGPSRRGFAIAGIVAAVAVLGAVLFWPGGGSDDDATSLDADDAESAPTTFGTLPDPNEDPTPSTSDAAPDDAGPDGDDDSTTVDEEGSGEPTLLDPIAGNDRPNRLELPAALAQTSTPTEVVLATRDGIATLSIPSGHLRWSTAGGDSIGGNLVTAPDAAAYMTNGPSGSTQLTIIPRVGAPIEVGGAFEDGNGGFIRGWLTTADGGSAFQVQTFEPNGDRVVLVDVGGGITEVDPAQSSTGFSTFDYARTTELNIVNDAGGVYLIEADGTASRIATGRAFAANGDHLLLRDCDATLACRLIVQNYVSGEITEVDPALEIANMFSIDLSPDGTALATVENDGTGVDTVQLVEIATGTVIDVGRPGPSFFAPGSLWLADSSGTVTTALGGPGLSFLDRSTGEQTEFGDELGAVYSLGVRYPDAELPPETGPLVDADIELSGELTTPTDLDIVVLGSLGTMARLDLDDGSAVAWTVPGLASGPPDLFAIRDSVTALTDRDGFVASVGEARPINTDVVEIPPGPRIAGPGAGLVWSPLDDTATDGVGHRLTSLDPDLPAFDGTEIVVAGATLLGGDGGGALVASAPGGTYAITASATSRLTTGELLALGTRHVLARECDTELVCRTFLLDRSTGERSTVVTPRNVGEAVRADTVAIAPGDGGPVGGTISPDGTVALTEVSDPDAAGWVLNDLATGNWKEIPAPLPGQPLIWSDDGSALVYLSEAGPFVYERATDQLLRINGLGEVIAVSRVTDEFAAPTD